jgi:hypothetical protein
MKQIIKPGFFIVILVIISAISFAQVKQSSAPRWISDKGYWVIETKTSQPLNHVVRFYNNDNVLVYKETLTGVRLQPGKRKVRMKLKKVLEESIMAWEKKGKPDAELAHIRAILN